MLFTAEIIARFELGLTQEANEIGIFGLFFRGRVGDQGVIMQAKFP